MNGTGRPGSTVTILRGDVAVGNATVQQSGEFIALVRLNEGANDFTAVADEGGPVSAPSNMLRVWLDSQAPEGTVDYLVDGGTYSTAQARDACGRGARSLCGTANDPATVYASGVASVSFVLQHEGTSCLGPAGDWSSAACGTPVVTTLDGLGGWSFYTGLLSMSGSYALVVTFTDVAGNSTEQPLSFTIQ